MIKPIFSIRDTLMNYSEPSTFYSEDVAKRDFIAGFKNHPNKDYYQLWKVGTFDTESGTMVGIVPELIMKGADF